LRNYQLLAGVFGWPELSHVSSQPLLPISWPALLVPAQNGQIPWLLNNGTHNLQLITLQRCALAGHYYFRERLWSTVSVLGGKTDFIGFLSGLALAGFFALLGCMAASCLRKKPLASFRSGKLRKCKKLRTPKPQS
jgi:hypothetical protein